MFTQQNGTALLGAGLGAALYYHSTKREDALTGWKGKTSEQALGIDLAALC